MTTRSRLFFFSSLLDYPSLWSFVLFFFAVRVVATCSLGRERDLSLFLFNDPPPPGSVSLSPLCFSAPSAFVSRRVAKQKKKKKEKAQALILREKKVLSKTIDQQHAQTRAWECKLYLSFAPQQTHSFADRLKTAANLS